MSKFCTDVPYTILMEEDGKESLIDGRTGKVLASGLSHEEYLKRWYELADVWTSAVEACRPLVHRLYFASERVLIGLGPHDSLYAGDDDEDSEGLADLAVALFVVRSDKRLFPKVSQ